MMTELEYVKRMMTLGGYSLVLCEGGRAFTAEDNALTALMETAESGENWQNCYCAVKTAGKAEALLLLHLRAKGVYAETIAKTAVRLLQQNDVEVQYISVVPNLLNAEKTGLLPSEQAVRDIDDPKQALNALR